MRWIYLLGEFYLGLLNCLKIKNAIFGILDEVNLFILWIYLNLHFTWGWEAYFNGPSPEVPSLYS